MLEYRPYQMSIYSQVFTSLSYLSEKVEHNDQVCLDSMEFNQE